MRVFRREYSANKHTHTHQLDGAYVDTRQHDSSILHDARDSLVSDHSLSAARNSVQIWDSKRKVAARPKRSNPPYLTAASSDMKGSIIFPVQVFRPLKSPLKLAVIKENWWWTKGQQGRFQFTWKKRPDFLIKTMPIALESFRFNFI